MTVDGVPVPIVLNSHTRRVLADVAALGPEGGVVVRSPFHGELEDAGFIVIRCHRARVTGEGLDALGGDSGL